MTRPNPEPGGLGRFLQIAFLIGAIGLGAELLLLGHYEDRWQLTPLALLASSLGLMAALALAPRPGTLKLFRAVMVLFVVGGALGLYFHLRANLEFELEMYPSLSGFGLYWESLRGAIPALAPGALAHLGLVGMAYTFRHPLLDAQN